MLLFHVICELLLYQYFLLFLIFFYVICAIDICFLHAFLLLQCGGESSNANARPDNDPDDQHAFDSDIVSDRQQPPVVDAARDNLVDEGVIDNV
jgi:hypothetical protein